MTIIYFVLSATPLSTPACEYQFGIYPDSSSCSTTYTKCAYGEPYQAHCDAGLAYDEKSHTCVWPDQLIPFCNPEAVIGFKCPSHPPNGAAARFWPFPRWILFYFILFSLPKPDDDSFLNNFFFLIII